MTINEVINEFREQNGKPRVDNWNRVVSDYCTAHCWAMVSKGGLYHTEDCYLQDWSEAIAECDCFADWSCMERALIFDILGNSPEHRDVLLNSSEMAYGIVMFRYKVFLTIRGR